MAGSEIRIRKDRAPVLLSHRSLILSRRAREASRDKKGQKESAEKEKAKEEKVEEEEEEKEVAAAAGSPEALIVSEFRVDGNPRAVLHPPAFLPRSLNIRTRLSYVAAAKEEEQKYENARRTGKAIAIEKERVRQEVEEGEGDVRALKRFPCSSETDRTAPLLSPLSLRRRQLARLLFN